MSTKKPPVSERAGERSGPSIWWWAFGYFAAYVPYSALTKALSSGAVGAAVDGVVVLPLATAASTTAMALFLLATGWWRRAVRPLAWPAALAGLQVPRPTPRTLLSGAATAAIVLTTTLAYTFEGVSIVFAMLLMRGGVLLVAPVIDLAGGRAVSLRSRVALVLTLVALLVAWAGRGELRLPLGAAVVIGIYLAAYVVRLRAMTTGAKAGADDNLRFFVEEQLVASPLALLSLSVWAVFGHGAVADGLVEGFTGLGAATAAAVVVVGVFSQLTGVFGGLILLDRRENSFCVPVNRASSILAGAVATVGAWLLGAGAPPSWIELVSAAILIAALLVLSWPRRAAPTP